MSEQVLKPQARFFFENNDTALRALQAFIQERPESSFGFNRTENQLNIDGNDAKWFSGVVKNLGLSAILEVASTTKIETKAS